MVNSALRRLVVPLVIYLCLALALLPTVLARPSLAQQLPGLFQRNRLRETVAPSSLDRARLRIVWGGGQATQWHGIFTLSDGTFENLTVLGQEPDAGANLIISGNELTIAAGRAADFFGFEIDIVNSDDQQLSMSLKNSDGTGVESQVINIKQMVFDGFRPGGLQLALDDQGNRLNINQAPGDLLPIEIDREHLVFEPGELFQFRLNPFRGIPTAGDNAEIIMTMHGGSGSDSHQLPAAQSVPIQWDGTWYHRNDPVQIHVPQNGGVYSVKLSLKDKSLAGKLNLGRKSISREIQFVVVDPLPSQPPRPEQLVSWTEVYNSDQADQPWIDRIKNISQYRNAGFGRNIGPGRTSGNRAVTQQVLDGKVWNKLAVGGWQTLPLQVEHTGRPHIIEIEYLADGPMALGISVLEPGPGGQIGSFGVDSGISIPRQSNGPGQNSASVQYHRIFHWPSHSSPYLLFANRHPEHEALIGSIRVLAGPEQLAAGKVSTETFSGLDDRQIASRSNHPTNANHVAGANLVASRQYLSFYEKPLFVENFSARKSTDQETGNTWHDWNSFLDGGKRWIQYLKANGYNGAMLVVAGDGSALYPSELLQPNTQFDSGGMSSFGDDPMRKDVVELLLRLFDREGLRLVPVFHFNAPLAELEQLRLNGNADIEGLLLVDMQGSTRLDVSRETSQSTSIYNPLDPRVQRAFANVVHEFSKRYENRNSARAIAGTGLLYSRGSVLVLPGQTWAVDQATMDRFLQESGLKTEPDGNPLSVLLENRGRQAWLQWRAEKMGSWLDSLKSAAPWNQPVYLLGTDMLESQDAFSALAPSLRRQADLREAYARIAFPTDKIAGNPDYRFLKPSEQSPEQNLSDERLNIQLNQSHGFSGGSLASLNSGTLFSHRCTWASFEQLGQHRLFGLRSSQPLLRLHPLSPAGKWNRRRLAESIASDDSRTLVEGGWLTPFGQEEHVVDLVEAFTRLPDVPFNDVQPGALESKTGTSASTTTGIVVRQATANGQNWFYVVNPTPWKLSATLRLTAQNTVIESYGSQQLTFDPEASEPNIRVDLEPFSLQAASVSSSIQVAEYRVDLPEEVFVHLQDRLTSLQTKVSRAAQVESVNFLKDPGFEEAVSGQNGRNDNENTGWIVDPRLVDSIRIKKGNSFQGDFALSLTSQGSPVWIRSNPFSITETGRLSIAVMLRTDNPSVQPPMRISIESRDGHQVYYRYGIVGGDSRKLTREWQEFAVHFDDLPLKAQSTIQVGFDLMAAGQVDVDHVRIFDRWLDSQDSRSLTHLLAQAEFQLSSKQNVDRCRRILDGYWPRFLNEFFPDETADAVVAGNESENRK